MLVRIEKFLFEQLKLDRPAPRTQTSASRPYRGVI